MRAQHEPHTPDGRTLLDRYCEIRGATQSLCAPLAPEDFVVQSMPDASPCKWHLAHTSWFFEEFVLRPFLGDYRPYHPAFGYLFNSYYEAVGPRHSRPRRGLLSRPALPEIFAYRAYVDEHLSRLLERGAESRELSDVITLGMHHEQQHQELLLTDIKHAFACNPLRPAYTTAAPSPVRVAPPIRFIAFDGGPQDIGSEGGFCFDNELPRHRVLLQPFRLSSRLVTNEEFREFIRSGGYARAEHWLFDGWAVVEQEKWQQPIYWSDSLEEEFTLHGMRELDPHAPVCHLSYYEADAFARWAGARLPTEFEWERAAASLCVEGNLLEKRAWHPVAATPVDPARPAQMYGDVWEWTRSAYAAYPGFRPAAGAIGEYNGKFMVNQLVLRGGSCATPRTHIRASYRNFFHPASRWQFSGLRLAMDD